MTIYCPLCGAHQMEWGQQDEEPTREEIKEAIKQLQEKLKEEVTS